MKKADVDTTPGARAPHAPGGGRGGPNPSSPHPDLNHRVANTQSRHVKGGEGYRGGGYMNSQEDAQSVLDAVHNGEATVLGTTRNGNLLVRYDGVTGYNNNPGAGYLDQPTNVFQIKGTAHPSVVPTSPTARPAP